MLKVTPFDIISLISGPKLVNFPTEEIDTSEEPTKEVITHESQMSLGQSETVNLNKISSGKLTDMIRFFTLVKL